MDLLPLFSFGCPSVALFNFFLFIPQIAIVCDCIFNFPTSEQETLLKQMKMNQSIAPTSPRYLFHVEKIVLQFEFHGVHPEAVDFDVPLEFAIHSFHSSGAWLHKE